MGSNMASQAHPSPLLELSDEILLQICADLDVPELLAMSRTCLKLRPIALDPILHAHRLTVASRTLSHQLPRRPTLLEIHPPNSSIYLTRTLCTARALSRSLLCIRLNRSLSRRPPVATLVTHNILPQECVKHDPRTGEDVYGSGLAFSLVGVRRSIERERVKDRLRTWVAERPRDQVKKMAEERGWVLDEEEKEKQSVRTLAQRFAGRSRNGDRRESRWGKALKEKKRRMDQPTRAHVLGLRRFWESIGRSGSHGLSTTKSE